MTYLTASAAAKTSVLSTLAMVVIALTVGPHAFAQQEAAPGETVQNGQQRGAAYFFTLDQILRQGPDGTIIRN